ncbi:TonB-dependent receptor [Flavobacterium aciduliphilum]|uniref:Iron complex outermembrane receptor protein n=1 Tax=Flavobacterium aciduliphilum TaxID=1101402 RepID=A0A328YDY8_9FLAO|nr:TonB-dependent receptor [Flavobacterium aciduliphilum]RAR71750.1 iron complex outermembrane receptor protein [Flavobacterium aciduliphilum]
MKSFFLALMLGFSIFASAQNTLVGTISNPQNTPLSGVTIRLPELHKETLSDENGTYTFRNIPNGSFKITCSYMGYETQTKSVEISQKETVMNIILTETIHQMDEVIISTAFNKLQSQNVMKVEHQSLKTLAQKGTSTLIEGLATIPGVSQVSTGTSIGKPVIRGLSGNRVLVYSQGVRLENQQFGEEHGLGLNDAGIESVEVIKGPASLLYGSDALGGVLYFNPEKFAAPNTLEGNFNQKLFSNTNGSSTSLGVKTSSDSFKFLARGSYNTHADYKIPDGNRVTNTRYNESDFKTALGYSKERFTSTLRYNFNKLDLGIPEQGIAEQTPTHKTTFPKQAVYATILSWNNTIFFKRSKLDADLGYISNNRSEFEDSDVANLHMTLKTYNYNVKYYLPKIGNFESIVGTQGMHQTNVNTGEEYLIPDATTNDFGVFGTVNFEWKKKVLQAGARFDHRNVTSIAHGNFGDEGYFQAIAKKFQSFNASLGFKTNIKKNVIFRLNFASGFRAPNLAELTSNGVHEGSNRYEVGNAALKNEQNFQTDLNLEYRNPHFEWFVNGFYNTINQYIFIAPNGIVTNGFDTYVYTQANAVLFGGEAGIHFHPHPVDWLHITSSFERVTGKKQNGENLPLIPANKWNNSIKTEFKSSKYLKDPFALLNVTYTFDQKNPSLFETKSNDYTLVNLGFGGKVTLGKTSFDVNLNANNLFNKTYISHLSRLKNEGIPNMGRTVVLGVILNM